MFCKINLRYNERRKIYLFEVWGKTKKPPQEARNGFEYSLNLSLVKLLLSNNAELLGELLACRTHLKHVHACGHVTQIQNCHFVQFACAHLLADGID